MFFPLAIFNDFSREFWLARGDSATANNSLKLFPYTIIKRQFFKAQLATQCIILFDWRVSETSNNSHRTRQFSNLIAPRLFTNCYMKPKKPLKILSWDWVLWWVASRASCNKRMESLGGIFSLLDVKNRRRYQRISYDGIVSLVRDSELCSFATLMVGIKAFELSP